MCLTVEREVVSTLPCEVMWGEREGTDLFTQQRSRAKRVPPCSNERECHESGGTLVDGVDTPLRMGKEGGGGGLGMGNEMGGCLFFPFI